MKKAIITAISLGAAIFSLSAQDMEWNVQAGLNLSSYESTETVTVAGKSSSGPTTESDKKAGFNVGILGKKPISNGMYVNSGLLFEQKGGKIKREYSELKETIYYVTIPLHFGYRYEFNENIAAFADFGPYFSVGVAGKTKFEDTKVDVFGDDGYRKRFDMGLGLRLGPEFMNKYTFSLGFDWGLFNSGKKEERKYTKIEQEIKNFTFSLNLGYKF